jgi:hypothetical protein
MPAAPGSGNITAATVGSDLPFSVQRASLGWSRTSDQNKDQPAMSPALLLRISAVVSFLFALGHTLGGMKLWSPMGENQVLELMRSVQFETMGVSRSYLDFYLGFGYCLSVAGFLQAVLLWQIASVAGRDSAAVRPMIAAITLAVAVSGIIAYRFIFPIPALFSLVLFAFLAAALIRARAR